MNFTKCAGGIGRLLVLAVCLGVAGCGPSMAHVDGKVTLDGEPLDDASIVLEPTDGKGPSAGANIESGAYSIDDVFPGPKTVRIRAPKVVGQQPMYPGDPNSTMTDIRVERLPKRYHDSTELTVDVQAPATTHDFELTSKKK